MYIVKTTKSLVGFVAILFIAALLFLYGSLSWLVWSTASVVLKLLIRLFNSGASTLSKLLSKVDVILVLLYGAMLTLSALAVEVWIRSTM